MSGLIYSVLYSALVSITLLYIILMHWPNWNNNFQSKGRGNRIGRALARIKPEHIPAHSIPDCRMGQKSLLVWRLLLHHIFLRISDQIKPPPILATNWPRIIDHSGGQPKAIIGNNKLSIPELATFEPLILSNRLLFPNSQ